jgi:N,N-dimethylformamidase
MDLVGYAGRFSVAPGETVRFMVSSAQGRYRADLVRLIHGDTNPAGPGFKERPVPSAIDGDYRGREQPIRTGSCVVIPDHPALRLTGSLSMVAWIYPTRLGDTPQGIMTKWSGKDGIGFGLFLDPRWGICFWTGRGGADGLVIATDQRPVRAHEWYFVGVSYDAHGPVFVVQEPLRDWPRDPLYPRQTLHVVPGLEPGCSEAPFVIGAYAGGDASTSDFAIRGHFEGKIEAPRLYARALTRDAMLALRDGRPAYGAKASLVAAWDLAADSSSERVVDRGSHGLHGRVVNAPTRAVTGHDWTGDESNPRYAPEQYGAIHFHADDLDDAGWESDFALTVPNDLPSGVYAARLRAGDAEDHVPFVVRPPAGKPTAPVAVLFPTLTYIAYANEQGTTNQYAPSYAAPRQNPAADAAELAYLRAHNLLSLYDFHADGSGVSLSSRLRPILNLRPRARMRHIDAPHGFAADLSLVDWLDHEGIAFDAITDEDLHADGQSLLDGYKVVVTGSHPEYCTRHMLDALDGYLGGGGRLMYLGGNGFYWVTSIDERRPHLIEVRRWGGTGAWKAEPGEYHHATTGELGGLWRNRGWAPQRTVGVGFTAQGFDTALPIGIKLSRRGRDR